MPWHSRWGGRHAAYRAKSSWNGSSDWTGDWVSKGEDFDTKYADTLYYKGNPAGTWMEYNITDMVQFFVNNPDQNYGIVISVAMDDPSEGHQNLGTDTVYQGYCFAGANPWVDSLEAYKPKLEIIFNENNAINSMVSNSEKILYETISINNKSLNILVPGNGSYCYSIHTVSGKAIVDSGVAIKGTGKRVYLGRSGMFIVTIKDNNNIVRRKIAVCK